MASASRVDCTLRGSASTPAREPGAWGGDGESRDPCDNPVAQTRAGSSWRNVCDGGGAEGRQRLHHGTLPRALTYDPTIVHGRQRAAGQQSRRPWHTQLIVGDAPSRSYRAARASPMSRIRVSAATRTRALEPERRRVPLEHRPGGERTPPAQPAPPPPRARRGPRAPARTLEEPPRPPEETPRWQPMRRGGRPPRRRRPMPGVLHALPFRPDPDP